MQMSIKTVISTLTSINLQQVSKIVFSFFSELKMAGAQSLQRAQETRHRLHGGPTLEIEQSRIDLLVSGNTGNGTPSAQ